MKATPTMEGWKKEGAMGRASFHAVSGGLSGRMNYLPMAYKSLFFHVYTREKSTSSKHLHSTRRSNYHAPPHLSLPLFRTPVAHAMGGATMTLPNTTSILPNATNALYYHHARIVPYTHTHTHTTPSHSTTRTLNLDSMSMGRRARARAHTYSCQHRLFPVTHFCRPAPPPF